MSNTPTSTLAQSDQGIQMATPKEAAQLVKRCFQAKRPVFLHGQPGIGKSELAEQLGRELNRPVIDIRLSYFDSVDLRGLPHFDPESKTARWSQPSDLPRPGKLENGMDTSNAILFLDELNTASSSVMAAAYQLILNRRIGEYKLPDDVVIMAAGNRPQDGGIANKIPTPLADRFIHFEIQPSFSDWVEWAANAGIRSEIIGYLHHSQSHWNTFDNQRGNKSLIFTTPRSWQFVNELLDDNLSDQVNQQLIAGKIGPSIALTFMKYREQALQIPNTADILSGKVTKIENLKIHILYTLLYNVGFMLRDIWREKGPQSDEYAQAYDTFLAFAMKNLEPELNIHAARSFTSEFKIPPPITKLKNFTKWWGEFKQYMPAVGG